MTLLLQSHKLPHFCCISCDRTLRFPITVIQKLVYNFPSPGVQFHSTETSYRKINLEKFNSDFHSEVNHHFSSTGPLFLHLLIYFSLFRMICHCNRNSFCFRIIKFKFSWDILECPWTHITCVLNPFFSNKTFLFQKQSSQVPILSCTVFLFILPSVFW